jgi:hypothetical protein
MVPTPDNSPDVIPDGTNPNQTSVIPAPPNLGVDEFSEFVDWDGPKD